MSWLFILKNAHIIAIIGVVGYLLFGQLHTIPKLKHDIQTSKQELSLAKAETQQLRADFDTYTKNQELVNKALSSKSTLIAAQSKLKASMHDIPVQTVDKPFSDPGMLDRANRLRDYQESSPAITSK